VEAAVELVRDEVAGDGDEERSGLLGVGSTEASFEQGGGGVDAAGTAGGLELGEVGYLGGGGRRTEDRGPLGDGCGAEFGEFGGVVEGVEVDVREHEDGAGLLGVALRWSEEGAGEEEGDEQRLHAGLGGADAMGTV
jgi:hypothetical protein